MEASRWGEVSRRGSYPNRRTRASAVLGRIDGIRSLRSAVRGWLTRRALAKKRSDFLVTLSALALPPASDLSGLALATGAFCLPHWRACVFGHALIPHASEEQDLSAAVTRSRATRTIRGPKRNNISHCRPVEESVDHLRSPSSLEAGRLQMVKKPGFPFTLLGCTTMRCKFSLWPTNTLAPILISELPGDRRVAPRDERAIAQSALGLAVQKRPS